MGARLLYAAQMGHPGMDAAVAKAVMFTFTKGTVISTMSFDF